MATIEGLDGLREREYLTRLAVNVLRREVYARAEPMASDAVRGALYRGEVELSRLARQRTLAEAEVARERDPYEVRGLESTGLAVRIEPRLAYVPTAIYHLLDPADQPLVTCRVRTTRSGVRRVRVTSFIEGYTARAIDTFELEGPQERRLDQLPTLFPDRTRELTELTSATLNVLIEDLDGNVESQQTSTVRLLARTTVPLMVRDPEDGWTDLSRYLGVFVTPNVPEIMTFLRTAAQHHPEGRLAGYQGETGHIEPQVRAVFAALKESDITYVNSVLVTSPEDGTTHSQRVRLPRESLADREANCVDATVLMASLLEAISLNPAIVVVPGHALLAWESWPMSDQWGYLECTLIGSATFEEACAEGERIASDYRELAEGDGDPMHFRRWPLRRLRAVHRITPME